MPDNQVKDTETRDAIDPETRLVSIWVPRVLWKKVTLEAATQERSQKSLWVEAMETYLKAIEEGIR